MAPARSSDPYATPPTRSPASSPPQTPRAHRYHRIFTAQPIQHPPPHDRSGSPIPRHRNMPPSRSNPPRGMGSALADPLNLPAAVSVALSQQDSHPTVAGSLKLTLNGLFSSMPPCSLELALGYTIIAAGVGISFYKAIYAFMRSMSK